MNIFFKLNIKWDDFFCLEYPKKMGPAREPIKYEELLIN